MQIRLNLICLCKNATIFPKLDEFFVVFFGSLTMIYCLSLKAFFFPDFSNCIYHPGAVLNENNKSIKAVMFEGYRVLLVSKGKNDLKKNRFL